MDTNGNSKELLLKDLCSRLPYRTKIHITGEGGEEIDADLTTSAIVYFESWTVQPYLRTMSSMTEEEKKEYELLANHCIVTSIGFVHIESQILIDWLNSHHFDYRGLIEKGLALEAPDGMYKKE